MSTPVTIDSLGAAPVLVKDVVGVLEQLHFKNTHDDALWIHAFDAASADGITPGTDPPVFRWYVPCEADPPDPTAPPFRELPMLRFNHGIVLAAVEEYFGGATGPAEGALRGGVIIE